MALAHLSSGIRQERNEIHPEDKRRCKTVFIHNYRITYVANPKQSTKLQKYMSLAKLQDTKSGYGINLFLYKSNEQSENEVNTDTVAPEKLFGDKFHKRYIEPNC